MVWNGDCLCFLCKHLVGDGVAVHQYLDLSLLLFCGGWDICVLWICFVVIAWFRLLVRFGRLGVSAMNGGQHFLTLHFVLLIARRVA